MQKTTSDLHRWLDDHAYTVVWLSVCAAAILFLTVVREVVLSG